MMFPLSFLLISSWEMEVRRLLSFSEAFTSPLSLLSSLLPVSLSLLTHSTPTAPSGREIITGPTDTAATVLPVMALSLIYGRRVPPAVAINQAKE